MKGMIFTLKAEIFKRMLEIGHSSKSIPLTEQGTPRRREMERKLSKWQHVEAFGEQDCQRIINIGLTFPPGTGKLVAKVEGTAGCMLR